MALWKYYLIFNKIVQNPSINPFFHSLSPVLLESIITYCGSQSSKQIRKKKELNFSKSGWHSYNEKLLLVTLVVSDSVEPCRRQPTRLSCPWDSPGKNTGVGCHFLLQCMKVKSEREVAQLCPTLCNPMHCSPPGSSTHEIFQARLLEWGAIAFSDCFHGCSFNRPISLPPRSILQVSFFQPGKQTKKTCIIFLPSKHIWVCQPLQLSFRVFPVLQVNKQWQ